MAGVIATCGTVGGVTHTVRRCAGRWSLGPGDIVVMSMRPWEAAMDSPFRQWMDFLKQLRGAEAEWPQLLRRVLTDTYLRERESVSNYAGEVFKDRDDDFPVVAKLPEKKAVKDLFHHCRREAGGVLCVGEDRYWLLGYEWPNQGGNEERGRRADLVGMNSSGGLVVFECKLVNNDGPLTAALEGLDYLSHLTNRQNFVKMADGFRRWSGKPQKSRPAAFEAVTPVLGAGHEVVVLASEAYFAQHRRSQRSPGWGAFAALPCGPPSPLSIRFAESDFTSSQARWVAG